jgi:Acyl-CoA synthetases (AMP-forming)/AMP-acid ligases II
MQLFEKTLGDWLEYWAEKQPDHDFIIYSDRDMRFTYKEFNERVNELAKGLMAIGVTKGTHVGIWATNVPDWNAFLFATAKIGAVLVTVNTNYKQHELEYLCDNADIHTLCITNGTFDSDYVKMCYEMIPELKTQARGFIQNKKFPYLKNVVYIGQEKKRGMYNTAELLLLGSTKNDSILKEERKNSTALTFAICSTLPELQVFQKV